MDQAEMSIGGIENGNSYFGIYTGHKHKVMLDRKRKWTLLEANQNGTHTHLKYERPLGGSNRNYYGNVIQEDAKLLPNYIPIKVNGHFFNWFYE
jgi:hypothetical protein